MHTVDNEDERDSELHDDDDTRSKRSRFAGTIVGGSKIRKTSPDRSSYKTTARGEKKL